MGASSRVRMLQFIPHLDKLGFEVTSEPLLDADYLNLKYAGKKVPFSSLVRSYLHRVSLLMAAKEFDVVWMEKEFLPWMPSSLDKALGRRAPVVVDYDDATFHSYDLHPNRAARSLFGRKIDRVMSSAAVVVAGNAYLADRARKAGAKQVEVIPSAIDLDDYPDTPAELHSPPALGWIGTPSTVRYLHQIARPLRQAVNANKAVLHVVGGGPIQLLGVPLRIIRWQEATEVQSIRAFDAGIMPLADTPWEWGKCGYKIIQYMACGLPTIASPIGVNSTIIDQGRNGFLAATETEWTQAISSLLQDPTLRARLGAAGRRKVVQEYSVQAVIPRLAKILASAGGA